MAENNDAGNWPKTLDEAVDRLLSEMPREQKARFMMMREGALGYLHFTLGMYVRNNYGLWQGNEELLKSCSKGGFDELPDDKALSLFIQPDSASEMIIKTAWRKLRAGSR